MRKLLFIALASLLVLSAASVIVAQFFPLTRAVRIVVSLPFLLFLPGLTWTFVLFRTDRPGRGIDWVERVALAFGLSLFVVPVVTFVLNRFGIPITTTSIFLEMLALIAAGAVILVRMRSVRRQKSNPQPHG